MSKNCKGYMGDQIGKLGPAVGSRWKGKMIYRAYLTDDALRRSAASYGGLT